MEIVKIRKMIKEDILGLASIYKQFWNEDSSIALMEEKFIGLQENPHYILLSAMEDNQLLGSVMEINY